MSVPRWISLERFAGAVCDSVSHMIEVSLVLFLYQCGSSGKSASSPTAASSASSIACLDLNCIDSNHLTTSTNPIDTNSVNIVKTTTTTSSTSAVSAHKFAATKSTALPVVADSALFVSAMAMQQKF